MTNAYKTIDEYTNAFPEDVRTILAKIRKAIRKAAPDAVEALSGQMPAFTLNGSLLRFAAFKNHIGFYPIPYNLISGIVTARVKQNLVQNDKSYFKEKMR